MGVDRPALPAWTEQESREEQAVSRSGSTDVAIEHAHWADPVVGAADKGSGWRQGSRQGQALEGYTATAMHASEPTTPPPAT